MNYIRRLIDVIGRANNSIVRTIMGEPATLLSPGEKLWNEMLRAKGCVKCTKEPKGFFEGPSGGMCTNIFCSRCGQGYNITPVIQIAELIHVDEKYIAREEP